jgi:hypothetical protein
MSSQFRELMYIVLMMEAASPPETFVNFYKNARLMNRKYNSPP